MDRGVPWKNMNSYPHYPAPYSRRGGYRQDEFMPRGRGGRPFGVVPRPFPNGPRDNSGMRFRPYASRMYDFGVPPMGGNFGEFSPTTAVHLSPLKVYARGIPFHAMHKSFTEFFYPIKYVNVWLGKFDNGASAGDAIVEFSTEADVKMALGKHRQHIGNRYVELFPATSMRIPPHAFYLLPRDSEDKDDEQAKNSKPNNGNRIPTTTEARSKSRNHFFNSNNNYYGYGQSCGQKPDNMSTDRATCYVANNAVNRVYCGTGPVTNNVGYAGYGSYSNSGPTAVYNYPVSYTAAMTSAGYTTAANQSGYTATMAPVEYSMSTTPTGYATTMVPTGYPTTMAQTGYNETMPQAGYMATVAPVGYAATPINVDNYDYYKAYYAQTGYICVAPPAAFLSNESTTVGSRAPSPPSKEATPPPPPPPPESS